MTRTPMARLPWLIRTHFYPKEMLPLAQKNNKDKIFTEILSFYHENVCCVYSLESLRRGDSNE